MVGDNSFRFYKEDILYNKKDKIMKGYRTGKGEETLSMVW